MINKEIHFTYNDIIDHDKLEDLLRDLRIMLDENIKNISLKRRIFTSLIEVLENIVNHNHRTILEQFPISLKIYDKDENIFIEVSNVVKNDALENINNKYHSIKEKSKDEIKSIFKKQIKETEADKNAGLGIFHIAMATNNNMNIKFEQKDNKHHTYTLSMFFKK